LLIVRKGEGEVMPVENQKQDPRDRLVREKYFCIRPRPLERWLWSKDIPASAERVFWLHWQEGMQRGDWCSEIPLSRVARECDLDVSTVTRAYQLLTRLGCVRRTDPGRNPENPFQQATAVTEVRVPRELLLELDSHPSRRNSASAEQLGQGRAVAPKTAPDTSDAPEPATTPDPLQGITGRDRARLLSQLTDQMSATERHAYHEALRTHQSHMDFDPQSRLSAEARATVLRTLAARPGASQQSASHHLTTHTPSARQTRQPRKLSLFELARLHRQLQNTVSPTSAPELARQVLWAIEQGALKRFDTRHALHIALKKIREGVWSRPHRMPPNWTHTVLGTCRAA
jgi:hypothetical protein